MKYRGFGASRFLFVARWLGCCWEDGSEAVQYATGVARPADTGLAATASVAAAEVVAGRTGWMDVLGRQAQTTGSRTDRKVRRTTSAGGRGDRRDPRDADGARAAEPVRSWRRFHEYGAGVPAQRARDNTGAAGADPSDRAARTGRRPDTNSDSNAHIDVDTDACSVRDADHTDSDAHRRTDADAHTDNRTDHRGRVPELCGGSRGGQGADAPRGPGLLGGARSQR